MDLSDTKRLKTGKTTKEIALEKEREREKKRKKKNLLFNITRN